VLFAGSNSRYGDKTHKKASADKTAQDLTPQRVSEGPLTIGIVQGACESVVSIALVQHGGS
jgi:hypothetical protein